MNSITCDEWKVGCDYFQGEYFFIVYRLKDKNRGDKLRNREYFGHYCQDRSKVQKIVDALNTNETEKAELLKKTENLNNAQSLRHYREVESISLLKARLNEVHTNIVQLLQLLELLIGDE